MWQQFFLENTHFALNVFAALAFFSIFWLYFDAWLPRKNFKDFLKVAGFGLLSLSFLAHATVVESTILAPTIITSDINQIIAAGARVAGYILVAVGILADPLEPKPKVKTTKALTPLLFLQPVLAAVVGFLYLRRATVGLENHLKKVALVFFVIAVSELLGLGALLRGSTNIDIFNFVAPFGPLWVAEHVVLLVGVYLLAAWGFSYLLKRIQTQLFIVITSAILVIFLATTVSFTGLLVKNVQDQTLAALASSSKVLSFALDAKKAETLSDAQILASDPAVAAALAKGDKKTLAEEAERVLLAKKESTVTILDVSGVILASGEDRDKVGNSLSNDPLVKRAILGEAASSVVTFDGVLAPLVHIRSATPVKAEASVSGVIMTGILIDNAFLDGIKTATGFEASIYGGNLLSATSIVGIGGGSRPLGVKEADKRVNEQVLAKGQNFSGNVAILQVSYLGSFLPLTDVDNVPVGMLFVGQPEVGVLSTASRSIELTFLVAAVLLVLSVFPAYFISKSIAEQLK